MKSEDEVRKGLRPSWQKMRALMEAQPSLVLPSSNVSRAWH